ncbi:hypothetical protein GCM10017687_34220 [Streptomyces echinatus]
MVGRLFVPYYVTGAPWVAFAVISSTYSDSALGIAKCVACTALGVTQIPAARRGGFSWAAQSGRDVWMFFQPNAPVGQRGRALNFRANRMLYCMRMGWSGSTSSQKVSLKYDLLGPRQPI